MQEHTLETFLSGKVHDPMARETGGNIQAGVAAGIC